MEIVKCNLCRSSHYKEVYKKPDAHYHPDEWFSVVVCKNCGLGFLNPRPTIAEMKRHYPSAFFDYFAIDKDLHLKRYAQEARIVEENANTALQTDRKLLDVGCANGDFPHFMQKRGWEVEGVEISANAQSTQGFPIYNAEFQNIPITMPAYDVVTAWAVLEHVHDPATYFRKAAQVLKPGGIFVFLVTNFESVTSSILFQEDVPRHTYFYTEKTVRQYCSMSGLDIISSDYSDKIYSMAPKNWLIYFLKYKIRNKLFRWEDYIQIEQHGFGNFIKSHNMSSSLTHKIFYSFLHPLHTLDRLSLPLYSRYQMLTKQYGIVTYVARKP